MRSRSRTREKFPDSPVAPRPRSFASRLSRLTSDALRLRWLLLLTVALLSLTALGLRTASSDSDPMIGVDTDPTGNSATAVDTIEACREVAAGETFQVDFTVQQVSDLAGFEADLHYNPSVLRVTAVDYELFLATAGTIMDVGDTPPDDDGTFSIGVSLWPLPDVGASGDGVLARLTFEAVGTGSCNLDLSGVKLADINVQPIGDTDDDDDFDGSVSKGEVAVAQTCPAPAPVASPTAAATPVGTPTLAATPAAVEAPPPTGGGSPTGLARAPPWTGLGLALAGGLLLAASVLVVRRSA